MALQVTIRRPAHDVETVTFMQPETVLIGRGEHCALRIDDPSVSRTHLALTMRDDTLWVEDRSTNGTLVGDTWLRGDSAKLEASTPLRIGAILLHAAQLLEPSPAMALVQAEPKTDLPAPNVSLDLRKRAHKLLLQHLDLVANDPSRMDNMALRPRVVTALRQIVDKLRHELPSGFDRDALVGELADEALGLGPLEQLLADPSVTEIMVVDPETIYVERAGHCVRTDTRFTDDARVRAVVERIVTPLGRRIDESQPLVDARLRDGSRVNAVIRPIALRGTAITIRKFPKHGLTLEKLEEIGSISHAMGRFLLRSVQAKKNIIVSGGTGSGKTTLLNILSSAIGDHERIITIEDSAELQLRQPHVVALETRPPNLEGVGAYTIRDLVRNALRMRPDRIVVGECRAGEAIDMLQAMNTGHEGSLTTVHANSPGEAVSRLETLCLMAGLSLPMQAIREQIASSVHLIVQQQRLSDGSRKIVEIAELDGIDHTGEMRLRPLYRFNHRCLDAQGKVSGSFAPTGYLPSYLGELIKLGLIKPGEGYL